MDRFSCVVWFKVLKTLENTLVWLVKICIYFLTLKYKANSFNCRFYNFSEKRISFSHHALKVADSNYFIRAVFSSCVNMKYFNKRTSASPSFGPFGLRFIDKDSERVLKRKCVNFWLPVRVSAVIFIDKNNTTEFVIAKISGICSGNSKFSGVFPCSGATGASAKHCTLYVAPP